MLEDRAQEESESDELNRPKYKVLMLSGPPGLGKTTLAHVAAMHSGEFAKIGLFRKIKKKLIRLQTDRDKRVRRSSW